MRAIFEKTMQNDTIIRFGNYVLQPGDVVVVKDKSFNLFDHYLIYLGNGEFVANMRDGIRYMDIYMLKHFEGSYYATRLRKFEGTNAERAHAVVRAKNCLQPSYSLLYSNCEHFANYVQFGKHQSLQSVKASVALIAAGAFASKESKSEPVQIIGALSILAGVLGLLNETFTQSENVLINQISKR